MGLGIRGWRLVGLGICKVGGVGSGSNHAPWILCSAARHSSMFLFHGPSSVRCKEVCVDGSVSNQRHF